MTAASPFAGLFPMGFSNLIRIRVADVLKDNAHVAD